MTSRYVHARRDDTEGVSLFGTMSSGQPRTFLGAAPFSHLPEHAAYGTVAWYIATDLDDWPLGPFASHREAALHLMGAEAVIAALRAHGRWQ